MDIHSLEQFLANPRDDNKRLSELQKQFASLWHARKCQNNGQASQCTLPICPEWRHILNHYSNCNSGYGCMFQSCGSSRVLVNHYNNCAKSDCRFCAPLRKHSTKKSSTIVCAQIKHTSGPSTSEFAASMSKGFCSEDWSESACTARTSYYSSYNQEYTSDDMHTTSTYQFVATSFTSRPSYGKTERIQRELIVMFHVQKCAELEFSDPSRTRQIECSVPHCQKMKRTLIHVAICQGEQCTFPECEVTRKIIQHWLRCPKRHCDVCCPVVDSIPALDEGSHYEMDDKLLALLYTSTNGLTNIESADIHPYEETWSSNICFDGEEADGVHRSHANKRKFSNNHTSPSIHDTSAEFDKKRRVD